LKNFNIKRVCCAIIIKKNKVLIGQRSDKKFKGLWEFPGGKVNKGESDENCLERELTEELGIKTNTGKIFSEVSFDYPNFRIHLLAYHSEIIEGKPKNIEHLEIKWVTISELHKYKFLEADIPIVNELITID
jgi:8-oxo-dGTP diphosphatase|tara:strand:- start:223 stop:618 length:396 start_codon:yes stop_codon:yes gene_type:complete